MSKTNSTRVKSYAKLNLALRITGRREDGYHNLSSLFQEIDLYDLLTFTPAAEYSLSCDQPGLPCDERNLCSRAYRAMQRLAGSPANWHIDLAKNIPVGSGLGGGSSNAAAVMKFLNRAWNLNLDDATLIRLAAPIGSDIPFYIRGKTQGVEGTGEILRPLQLPLTPVFLLVCPPVHISTVWAYQQFTLINFKEGYKFDDLFGLKRIHYELFENEFESVVFPAYPEIGRLKQALLSEGADYAGLSGSGSTVFGIFPDRLSAETAGKHFVTFNTFVTLPIQKR